AEDPKVLVEAGLAARAAARRVLLRRDGREPSTTRPGEEEAGADLEFCDYEATYLRRGTVSIDAAPAPPDALPAEARGAPCRAFRAVGLEGLARVDMFVTTDHRVLVNEVNTMPGFTPYSMFPVLWRTWGSATRISSPS